MGKIRKLIIENIYSVLLKMVKLIPVKQTNENKLLLVKTDEIGDYILFRNYFKIIRKSEKYQNFKITLVGNNAWKSLFLALDGNSVDETFWLEKNNFKSNLKYRFQFLKKFRSQSYTHVVNCIYSRGLNTDDAIVVVTKAKEKIGMVADFSNRNQSELRIDNEIYDILIDSGINQNFDFFRNQTFISELLNISKTELHVPYQTTIEEEKLIEQPYVIVFSSAGKPEKKWKPEYFADIIEYVKKNYGYKILICGSPSELRDSEAIISFLKNSADIENCTGKTSLLQTMVLLKHARLAISVDTGSVHMAASVACPIVALFSGKHYGRFAPYPNEVFAKFFVVYPDHIEKYIQENNPILDQPERLPNEAIQLIPPEKVIEKIAKALK